MHRIGRPRLLALVLVVALVGLLGGCGGGDDDGAPGDCTPIEGGKATLVAELIQWDVTCLKVTEGTTITFTVDNRDDAVDHNLNVFGPSGKAKTELQPGPITQTLVYEATTDGYHQYVCDIHANMEGQLWVEPAAAG